MKIKVRVRGGVWGGVSEVLVNFLIIFIHKKLISFSFNDHVTQGPRHGDFFVPIP